MTTKHLILFAAPADGGVAAETLHDLHAGVAMGIIGDEFGQYARCNSFILSAGARLRLNCNRALLSL